MATTIENSMQPEMSSNPQQSAQGNVPRMHTPPSKAQLHLQEYLYICLSHWYWFLISIVVCMGIGYVYFKKSTPIYQKSAAIIIKTDSQGRSTSFGSNMFEDLGISRDNSMIMDEINVLRSPDLMRDVVRRINLNTRYWTEGRFRTIELYGKMLPVRVELPDLSDTDNASFKLKVNPNGDYEISDMYYNGNSFDEAIAKGRVGTQIRTKLGRINVIPAESFNNNEEVELTVTHSDVKGTAGGFSGGLDVNSDDQAWNMVNLKMTDSSPERATDVLTTVIAAYNDRWMNEKRTLADNSSKFIDERVQLLQNELGSVENDISSFKSANLMPDVDAAASMYMSQASQASMALRDLRNQEYMAKYIRNYMRNADNKDKLLPSSAGFSNTGITSQITAYNTKIMERNSLVSQSSETNPLVTEIDNQLNAMRGALVATLDNEVLAITEQIRSQEGFTGAANSKIAANPRQAKYLLSIERQQKVKESLYLYLLQKREENQLNQALTSYNTRIVREADGSDGPIAPNGSNIMLIAFSVGLLLPALILFQREMSVHVVRGRKDIKDMHIPFAGEIPIAGKKQKLAKPDYRNKNPEPKIVVKENNRNSINEAFRVLRTNLEFMFGNNPKATVVMLTSANPGSGKTFVAYNLAKSFAIKNKRVIAIDLDMRKASLSKFVKSPNCGISDYLADRVDDITKIIYDTDNNNMKVIPVGTMPPNPTELLFNDRMHALIEDLKMHYDYVFIDCPPVEVVADSSIVSKYADYTLFVARAGVLDKSLLPVIDEIYEKGTYPNMSLILNGTLNPRNPYARRYGNPYSYGYGYGTGYHYASED